MNDPDDALLRELADPARRDHLQARPGLAAAVLAGTRERRRRDRILAVAGLAAVAVAALAAALPALDALAGTVLGDGGDGGDLLAELLLLVLAAPLALVAGRRHEVRPC